MTTEAQPQPPAATAPQNAAGNIPGGNLPAGFKVETFQTTRGRDPETGRMVSLKAESAAKDPRLGENRQTSAVLNSPAQAGRGTLQAGGMGMPEGGVVDRGIKGLSDIPKSWPKELPGSVSLGVEVSWVQSNRLLVVKELPSGGVKVDLSKARQPAPSWSALSWLETSIRSYAKFVEVAAKTASSGDDEAEFIRRERMQIAEIDALLAEMYDAEKG